MSRAKDLFDRLAQGGEPEVMNFIAQQVTEELFLDYKRSADDGANTTLNNKDRSNLAKAISGFGNSEGGVIVWGVDCRTDPQLGDVPSAPHKIQSPNRFKSWLEQATTGLTVPSHGGVIHHTIPEGFVITLIPSGLHAPYQTVGELSYYIRAGSNFSKAPHAVLAGMFGRRPQPAIKNHYLLSEVPTLLDGAVETQIGIILRNFGMGIAEDVFINLGLTSHPGGNCQIEFLPSDERDAWWGRVALGNQVQLITRAGFRLPPEADLLPVSLKITLRNPIERDFSFQGICGCTGGESWRFQNRCSAADIVEATDRLLKTPAGSPDLPLLFRKFNRLLFEQAQN